MWKGGGLSSGVAALFFFFMPGGGGIGGGSEVLMFGEGRVLRFGAGLEDVLFFHGCVGLRV